MGTDEFVLGWCGVMLGDFTVKKPQNLDGKSLLNRNKMWCVAENHNYICHIYMFKRIFIFEF